MSRPLSVSSRIANAGREHGELEDLGPLLLAAGEALVQVAAGELRVHAQLVHRGADLLAELAHRDQVFAFLAVGVADVGDGVAEEVGHRDARDRGRILEGQEQPGLGPLVGLQLQQVAAVERRRPRRDLVVRVAHQRVAERALARAVRPHQGMGLTLADREVDAPQDLLAADGDVQVVDRKHLAHQSPARDCGLSTRSLGLGRDARLRIRQCAKGREAHTALAGPGITTGLASKSQERWPSSRHWLRRRLRPSTFSNIFRSMAQTPRSASASS